MSSKQSEPVFGRKICMQHFSTHHAQDTDGRFIVPLLRKPGSARLGETHSQAVKRFLSLERSLHFKGQFEEVNAVMQEYLDLHHAEPVPVADLQKPNELVYYFPIHVMVKESSTTTKIRAVIDASAKSSIEISLNDTLMIGQTVHSSLFDVLLRF